MLGALLEPGLVPCLPCCLGWLLLLGCGRSPCMRLGSQVHGHVTGLPASQGRTGLPSGSDKHGCPCSGMLKRRREAGGCFSAQAAFWEMPTKPSGTLIGIAQGMRRDAPASSSSGAACLGLTAADGDSGCMGTAFTHILNVMQDLLRLVQADVLSIQCMLLMSAVAGPER